MPTPPSPDSPPLLTPEQRAAEIAYLVDSHLLDDLTLDQRVALGGVILRGLSTEGMRSVVAGLSDGEQRILRGAAALLVLCDIAAKVDAETWDRIRTHAVLALEAAS